MLVGDDGNGLVDDGKNDVFADEVFIPLVGGVDGDGRVAEHRFGTGGGDDEIFIAALHGILQVPEEGVFFGILHLGIGEGRPAAGAPVDYARAAVDEPLVVEVDEYLPHRLGALFVHGEGETRPIARRAHLFELFDYPSAVFFLPGPGAL